MLVGSEDVIVWFWNVDIVVCMVVFFGYSGVVICGDFIFDGKLCFLFFCLVWLFCVVVFIWVLVVDMLFGILLIGLGVFVFFN